MISVTTLPTTIIIIIGFLKKSKRKVPIPKKRKAGHPRSRKTDILKANLSFWTISRSSSVVMIRYILKTICANASNVVRRGHGHNRKMN